MAATSSSRSTRLPTSSTSSTSRPSFKAKIEELGGTAAVFDAKDQAELGVNLVNDAISQGAKGIAITVPDQAIGPAIAKAAADAGIPLIATDDPIEDEAGNPIPFVGFDGTDMGNKVGEEAGRLLTESGWLTDGSVVGMLAVEKQDLSVCELRTEAAEGEGRPPPASRPTGSTTSPQAPRSTPRTRLPVRSSRRTPTSRSGSSPAATTRASSARSTR